MEMGVNTRSTCILSDMPFTNIMNPIGNGQSEKEKINCVEQSRLRKGVMRFERMAKKKRMISRSVNRIKIRNNEKKMLAKIKELTQRMERVERVSWDVAWDGPSDLALTAKLDQADRLGRNRKMEIEWMYEEMLKEMNELRKINMSNRRRMEEMMKVLAEKDKDDENKFNRLEEMIQVSLVISNRGQQEDVMPKHLDCDIASHGDSHEDRQGCDKIELDFIKTETVAQKKNPPKRSYNTIKIVKGDLFQAGDSTALAHCVGEDLLMTNGIAARFKEKFGHQEELLRQQKRIGEVAVLQEDNRAPIFYLITKKRTRKDKPSLQSLYRSLTKMKQLCLSEGITEVAMPKIGCGMDRLKWSEVRRVIHSIFNNTKVNITVYVWNGNRELARPISDVGSPNNECINAEIVGECTTVKDVLVIGDSMVYNVGKIAKKRKLQWHVHSMPGIRMDQLTRKIANYQLPSEVVPKQIIVHVGTNSIRGWKKINAVVGDTLELMDKLRKNFPLSDIAVTGITYRLDVSTDNIDYLNDEINWVVHEMGGTFIDINNWIWMQDCIGRDGIHLNYKGCDIMTDIIVGLVNKLKPCTGNIVLPTEN